MNDELARNAKKLAMPNAADKSQRQEVSIQYQETERYRSFAVSDDKKYLAVRERTIHALQASGVP
jgi:spore germination protein YaaH